MGRVKLARPVLFLALTALLATCAQASVPSASATLAPNHFERLSAPSLSAALDVASLEPRDDAPRFALDEVSLLGEPRSVRFHLTGDELRPQPLTVFEPSYPETRVGAFDFLGTPLVGVSSGVSHELQRGCGDSWLGTPEGIGNWLSEDPAGDIDSPNRYAYVGWRPNEYTDPTGENLLNPLDWASLGVGGVSLYHNVSERNWGAAGLDVVGIAADIGGMVYQYPSGVGAAIKAGRAARAIHALQVADRAINVGQGFYQSYQEDRQGNYGWSMFYMGMAGLGLNGSFNDLGLRLRPSSRTFGMGVSGLELESRTRIPRPLSFNVGIGENELADAVSREIVPAVRNAKKILDSGSSYGTAWGEIHHSSWIQAPGLGWLRGMARGNAVQQITNELLTGNQVLKRAGVLINEGSAIGTRSRLGFLLRPDFQIPLGNNTWGIIDITTSKQASKITKYADPAVIYMRNLFH